MFSSGICMTLFKVQIYILDHFGVYFSIGMRYASNFFFYLSSNCYCHCFNDICINSMFTAVI